jgi:hypothetical protein
MCAEQKSFHKAQTEFGRVASMTASAPRRAPGQLSQLQIELRESGGVAGIQRTVALKGDTLQVIDGGRIQMERHVPITIVQSFADRVKALETVQPKRSYGRYNYNSDILTTQLEIFDAPNGLEVQVISDPRDPAPSQFWEIVNDLRRLSKVDLATASDF